MPRKPLTRREVESSIHEMEVLSKQLSKNLAECDSILKDLVDVYVATSQELDIDTSRHIRKLQRKFLTSWSEVKKERGNFVSSYVNVMADALWDVSNNKKPPFLD